MPSFHAVKVIIVDTLSSLHMLFMGKVKPKQSFCMPILYEMYCRPRRTLHFCFLSTLTNPLIGVSEFIVGWESETYIAIEGEAVELCLQVRSETTVETSVRFSVNTSSGQAQGKCIIMTLCIAGDL